MKDYIKEWRAIMDLSIEGRLTLKNIYHDIDNNRLPGEALSDFFEELAKKWAFLRCQDRFEEMSPSQKNIEAYKIFNEVIKTKDLDEKSFFCQCSYGPNKSSNFNVSRVMSWKSFIKYHIKEGTLIFDDQGPSDEQIADILVRWETKYNAESYMQTRRPFAWITKSSFIQEIMEVSSIEKNDDLGSIVRDRLGLVAYQSGESILEIQYPTQAVNIDELKAPTFLDSDCTKDSVYCSVMTDDGCGRTINLSTCEPDAPEVIHPKINFSNKYSLRNLGRIRRSSNHNQEKITEINFPEGSNIKLGILLDEVLDNLRRD
ncbi:hypothetical protein [Acaryochloris thomasi]|nr:hypothetical protein [Acaryochloris thomasi]